MASNDDHIAIRELSGAAALRALTPDEARRVMAHLATCAPCRAEYDELRAAAEVLLRLPEPIEPSADLRNRIMAAIADLPQDAPGAADSPAREFRRVVPLSPPARSRDSDQYPLHPADPTTPSPVPRGAPGMFPLPPGAASRPEGLGQGGGSSSAPHAPGSPPTLIEPRRRWDWRDLGMVASLAAALYLGFWTLRLQSDLAVQSELVQQQGALVRAATAGRVVPITATDVAPQVRGAVADGPDGVVVYLDNLPQPAPDRAYEVWLIPPGGQPIPAGLSSGGQGGTQTIRLNQGLTGIEQVAVTEEPAAGSPGPTSQPLAVGRLRAPR